MQLDEIIWLSNAVLPGLFTMTIKFYTMKLNRIHGSVKKYLKKSKKNKSINK